MYIIVLGTAQYDGRPSRIFAARIRHAAVVRERTTASHRSTTANHRSTTVITVGGNLPGDRFTEAGVAKRELEALGVRNVHAVPEGNDTRTSLEAALREHPELLDARVVIVTDPLHRPRTWLIARSLGLHAQVTGAPECPTRFPTAAWWRMLAHEAGGLLVWGAEQVVGRDRATALRERLHVIEAYIRPSRRARHEELARQRRSQPR